MSSVAIGFIVFVFVFGAALIGNLIQRFLPEEHGSPDSRDVVRLGMGLVGTILALVLGLLIASAKSFYDTQTTELVRLSADTVLLDRILSNIGPEAKEARVALRNSVARLLEIDWSKNASAQDPTEVHADVLFERIHELSPTNDYHRTLQSHAFSLAIETSRTRWLMFEQRATSVPRPLLVAVVFWLIVLFVSFGLFVRPNATVVTSLFFSAIAVAGAVVMILEMYSPYSGMIQIPRAPLKEALAHLCR